MPRKLIFSTTQNNGHRDYYFWNGDPLRLGELWQWLRKTFPEEELNKLARLLNLMGQSRGPRLHHSTEKYKKFSNKVYTIKSNQIRLYGVVEGHDFIVIYYHQKKSNKVPAYITKQIEATYEQFEQYPD